MACLLRGILLPVPNRCGLRSLALRWDAFRSPLPNLDSAPTPTLARLLEGCLRPSMASLHTSMASLDAYFPLRHAVAHRRLALT
jgi:hypothetical protein